MPCSMKPKIIGHSILWASRLIATTIMYRHTDSYGAMFSILLACAATSIAILAAPDCEKKTATSEDA